MEVSLVAKDVLRLKSKQATFFVNPVEKMTGANAVAFLSSQSVIDEEEVVVLSGQGEYEIGGVKISGIRSGDNVVYSFILDEVNVLVGRLTPLDILQHKLKEYEIVIIVADEVSPQGTADAAFVTGLASSVLMAYGPNAKTLIDSFAKENTQTLNKFAAMKDKLPLEVQTILLANG